MDHNIPLTHMYNPRVYIPGYLSQAEQDKLTQWILGRKTEGDEIALHLHMYHDMVKAAGIEEPIKDPKWGHHTDTGYDVPCAAYDYDEFSRVIAWSINIFEEKGLGKPVSFRAGGWYADLENIQVLNDYGFLIESSNRDQYSWGYNKLPGYWTTINNQKLLPYQISMYDQNLISDTDLIEIWEYPNNGSNSSYNKSDYLIGRFLANYQGLPLDQTQVLTYLSHAQEFLTWDYENANGTLNYIDQFGADKDNGPIVYVTLEEAYTNNSK